MSSRFSNVITAGLDRIRGIYAKTATFINGDGELELTNVVIGKRTFRFVDDNGFTVHKETRDFIVENSQMFEIEPKIGDLIKQSYGDPLYRHTFKVVSLNNEPCFYASDDDDNTIRIHTLFVSKEPDLTPP